MNVVTLGRVDKSIFEVGSLERTRIAEYGKLFDHLTVIAFFPKRFGFQPTRIASNVEIIPTNSRFSLLYLWDGYGIAEKILHAAPSLKDWVISTQDPFEAGFLGYLLTRQFRIPLQIQIHTDVMSPHFARESVKNRIRQTMARFVVQRAQGIRVVSKRIFRSLVLFSKDLEKKIIVLPIFVPSDPYRSTDTSNSIRNQWQHLDFIFLMASRLTREKDIPMAIRAVGQVTGQFPRTGLFIIGDGPEKSRLMNLVKKLNLQEHVIFIDRTEHLAEYYQACDALLISSRYEGYGRTAVESLAAGRPVIMTDVGLADWIVRDHDNGLIIPVGDEDALVVALKAFLSDRVLRHRMRESAGDLHGGEMTKERYDELYKASIVSLTV